MICIILTVYFTPNLSVSDVEIWCCVLPVSDEGDMCVHVCVCVYVCVCVCVCVCVFVHHLHFKANDML